MTYEEMKKLFSLPMYGFGSGKHFIQAMEKKGDWLHLRLERDETKQVSRISVRIEDIEIFHQGQWTGPDITDTINTKEIWGFPVSDVECYFIHRPVEMKL